MTLPQNLLSSNKLAKLELTNNHIQKRLKNAFFRLLNILRVHIDLVIVQNGVFEICSDWKNLEEVVRDLEGFVLESGSAEDVGVEGGAEGD